MSEWWDGQLDTLSTLAEIFFRLTAAEQGGDENLPYYKEFRASRLQLRFAQDLVCCIEYFLSKERELYERDLKHKIRNGSMGIYATNIVDRGAEHLAAFATQEDQLKLERIVRRLSFGREPDSRE